MPFVNIRIVEGVFGEKAQEKKAEISRRVTDAITEFVPIPPDSVWVVFEDVPASEWYVGARSVEQRGKEEE